MHSYHPDANPEYLPLDRKFSFIEIRANGSKPLNQFFKTLGMNEGFVEDILYVYWPRDWWEGVEEILTEPPPKGRQLQWLKVMEGKLVAASFVDK